MKAFTLRISMLIAVAILCLLASAHAKAEKPSYELCDAWSEMIVKATLIVRDGADQSQLIKEFERLGFDRQVGSKLYNTVSKIPNDWRITEVNKVAMKSCLEGSF